MNPDQQGKGIGKLLFKHITDRADAEGRKCYLESSRDKPNTEIYERLGFQKVKRMTCDDEGVVCEVSPVESFRDGIFTRGQALLHDSRVSIQAVSILPTTYHLAACSLRLGHG